MKNPPRSTGFSISQFDNDEDEKLDQLIFSSGTIVGSNRAAAKKLPTAFGLQGSVALRELGETMWPGRDFSRIMN
jgi:hypothetical protein